MVERKEYKYLHNIKIFSLRRCLDRPLPFGYMCVSELSRARSYILALRPTGIARPHTL